MFHQENFAQLAQEIASALECALRMDGKYAFLTDRHGREFDLYIEVTKKRLHVSGIYGRDERNRYVSPASFNLHSPKISVSLEKPVTKIVADIQRRFLPNFIETFDKIRLIISQRIGSANGAETLLIEIAKILNVAPEIRGDIQKCLYVRGGMITADDGETLSLDLIGVPKDKALRIVEILKD